MSGRASEYVFHGWRSFHDYDRPRGNQRQFLVTDLHANIVSNFLAVFLVLAGKSVFNIADRILWVYLDGRKKKAPPNGSVNAGQNADQDSDQSADQRAGQAASHQADQLAEQNPDIAAGSQRTTIGVQATTIVQSSARVTQASASSSSRSDPGNASNAPRFEPLDVQEPYDYHSDRQDAAKQYYDNEGVIWDSLLRILSYFKGTRPMLPIKRKELLKPTVFARYCKDWYIIIKNSPGDTVWYLSVGTVAALLYCGIIVLGIVSPYPVVDGSVALSQHPSCSLVAPADPDNDDIPQQAMGMRFFTSIARESRQYAESCYSSYAAGAHNTDSCYFFYTPHIEYSTKDDDLCPFRVGDDHLCLEGEQSAYTVVTSNTRTTEGLPSSDFIDASDIGINSPWPYKFYRRLSCAPLKTEGFIRRFTEDDGRFTFRYFYGNRAGDNNCTEDLPNCSYELTVDPNYSGPYDLTSDSTRPLISKTWQPVFAVDEKFGELATLILISNFGISYPYASPDPIFHANTTIGDGWYYNLRGHASVLGCMSATLVCYPENSTWLCYNLTGFGDLGSKDPQHGPVRGMLLYSLLPDLQSQLGYLKAEALNAQSLLSGSFSSQPSKTQWKDEVRQLFEQMLARTQITARNIARGVPGTPLPNQTDLLKPYMRRMCTQYKFLAVGWKNISLSWFLVEFSVGLVISMCGIRRDKGKPKELWVERPARWLIKSRFGQCFVWMMQCVWASCRWVSSKVSNGLCSFAKWCCGQIFGVLLLLGDYLPAR